MKNMFCIVSALALAGGVASADTYLDATDDLAQAFTGFDHLNISSVEVTNDADFVYFAITMVGDLDSTNWGKYVVGLDTGRNAGDNSTDPGSWNRNVDWGRGITDFVGSWADDGGSGAGAELRSFDGSAWNLTDATYAAGTDVMADDSGHSSGVQMLAVSLSALGLGDGDTIEFDVFSTGGGADPGVDHLSRGDFSTDDWGNTSFSGQFLSYTINVVPLPSAAMAGLVGLIGLGGIKRLRG
ncbi:MAG: hypothetical protein ACWA5W_08750 [Phycisphaerales bacterium]